MIVLGVIKMLTHFPAEFCFPWSETKFSTGETHHVGEPLSPDTRSLGRRQHSRTHTCHKHSKSQLEFTGCSRQVWSEGSKKRWAVGKSGLNFQTCIFTMRSCFLWVRHALITRLPTARDTNRYLVLYCRPSCQLKFVMQTPNPLLWSSCYLPLQDRCKTFICNAQKMSGCTGIAAHCQWRGHSWENNKVH